MSAEMKQLIEEAEELSIKVDGRWSEERIQSEIDKKKNVEESKDATKYSPCVKGRVEILGVHICEGFTPSDALMKNERFTTKLKHAIKCGLVKEL